MPKYPIRHRQYLYISFYSIYPALLRSLPFRLDTLLAIFVYDATIRLRQPDGPDAGRFLSKLGGGMAGLIQDVDRLDKFA